MTNIQRKLIFSRKKMYFGTFDLIQPHNHRLNCSNVRFAEIDVAENAHNFSFAQVLHLHHPQILFEIFLTNAFIHCFLAETFFY